MEMTRSEAAPACIPTTTAASAPGSTAPPSMLTQPHPTPTPPSSQSSDRPAGQMIQQAIPKPASVTTQYLQQIYAAQQHHVMVQTTSVQQHPTALTTHSPASVQQSNSGQSTSTPPVSNGNAAQTTITSQPIRQLQATSSAGSAGAISQHALLLGSSSPPGSQAQMYLHTQMLILAPATSVSADLPALTSASSQSGCAQVSSLSMRTHLPGALTAAPGVQLKVASQGQSLPKMPLCPLKSVHLSPALVETSSMFSPIQSPALLRQHCAPSPKAAPPQLILQSSTAHRQLHPIALRVTPQDSGPPPLSLQSQQCEILSVPTPSDLTANQTSVQQQAAVVSTSTLPAGCPAVLDPPPLHLGPVVEPLPQPPPLSCPLSLSMALPRLAVPPASLQRLSLRSVHTLAVQSDHMLLSDNELPGADAPVQLPYQNLPPPQTVAVDLKVQPPTSIDPSAKAARLLMETEQYADQVREEECLPPPRCRTPTPPALSPLADLPSTCSLPHPKDCTGAGSSASSLSMLVFTAKTHNHTQSCIFSTEPVPQLQLLFAGPVEHSCLQSSRSMIQSAEESALNTNPPPLLCAAVGPQVGRTSQDNQQKPGLPQDKELPGNGAPACHDFLLDTEQPESDQDNTTFEDERLMGSLPDVLQCEFCGRSGYAHTFLRSKRFCSMTCVRRFNVSCTKRLSALGDQRVNRWPNRSAGRRGRPPRRANRNSQNHFLTQLHGSYSPDNMKQTVNSSSQGGGEESEKEDSHAGPMTTRLRLQADRERDQEQGRKDTCSSSTWRSDCSPAQWSVEQVCSYISSLPGCQDVVVQFRSQEIDGQALLLLTEEHLISFMNIKLGPALKICAHINSLKEP